MCDCSSDELPVSVLNFALNGVKLCATVPEIESEIEFPVTVPEIEFPVTDPEIELPVTVPEIELPVTVPEIELPVTVPETELPVTVPETAPHPRCTAGCRPRRTRTLPEP